MKQYLTKEEIEESSIEELENNVKIKEELDELKESLETEESKERFKELVHLKILSNSRICLIEFSDMVWKNKDKRKRGEDEEE